MLYKSTYFSPDGKSERYKIQMKYLKAIFVGTGDLFASCLMAWMSKDKDLKVQFSYFVIYLKIILLYSLPYNPDF